MVGRLIYFIRQAVLSIRESPGTSVLTSVTIATALLILGLYSMALQNLEGLALVWGRSASIAAYIDDHQPPDTWEDIRGQLGAIEGVQRTTLISPREALDRFKNRGPQAAALVEGVTEDILPASVEIFLEPGFVDLDRLTQVAQRVRAVPSITDVDYGQSELERLASLLDLLRFGGITAGILLTLATAFIVSNTIRLNVYSRRDEILILRLVGATGWFVRTPFLLEGAIWGAAGGALSVVALWLADAGLSPHISLAVADMVGGLDLRLFAINVGVGMLILGTILGVLGSGLAVRRFMEDEGSVS